MLFPSPIHKSNYTAYIKQLPFSENIIKAILNRSDTDKSPGFYQEYASLFANSFEFNDAGRKIELLNIAGYLCYNYSLLLDTALDKEAKHSDLMLANIYLEEAIKILTSLFGLDKRFWSLWNIRKQAVFEGSMNGKKAFGNPHVSIYDWVRLPWILYLF
jgi:squalene-hopene/tetraprenyl-beta-curcumene cyclase